jgi:rhodanese-related sulfurtransferase
LKAEIKAIITEAAVVVFVGAGFGLVANQFSPRGLALSRNYFPAGTNRVAAAPVPAPPAPGPAAPDESADAAQVSERLRDKGLQEVKRKQVETLFHDPRHQDGRVVFVDARAGDGYEEGHIPGAYQLDPYHPEKEIGTVLSVCKAAEMVVVYCTGGECEDSDTAAILLRDGGVPGAKIFVYGGGSKDWQEAQLPLETGPRNSGLTNSVK